MNRTNNIFWQGLAEFAKSILACVDVTYTGAEGSMHIDIVSINCFLQPLITPKCRMPSKKLQWEIPHFCMCLQRSFYAGEMSLQTYFCF